MKKMIACMIAGALSLSLLAGCAAKSQPVSAPTADPVVQEEPISVAAGTVLLSVNPEIEVEYDGKGLVIEIEGRNEDGRKIVASYDDFRGKSCEDVVRELVEQIYAGGYFAQSVGGKTKNVVVKLEEGSSYPGDDFLEEVARGVRQAVEQCGVDAKPMTVDKKDLDDRGYIGLEKAKELVLEQLDLKEADFTDKEYGLDDSKYELEFTADGVEYEFEVHAVSGKVLEAEVDRDDDRYDDDWDDDDRPAKPVQSTQNSKGDKYITLEKAQKNALKYLGLDKEARFTDREQELDDGKYELEFTCDGVEYEVDVDARTGEILKVEQERDDDRYDDDWDDRYDDDDDDDDDDDWDD